VAFDPIHVTLRILHIVSGVFWVGAIAYSVLVLGRVLPRVDPPVRKQLMKQLLPVALKYIPITATSTITFGILMYLYLTNFDLSTMLGILRFQILFAAMLITLGMFTFGMLIGFRTGLKIKAHLDEEKCEHMPLVGALQKRFALSNLVVFVIGVTVVALMAIAVAS